MKKLTVFTPAFNRAYCIHQLYESLLRQTNQNFVWLIVDDGSSDNTKELIQKWIDEKKLEIIYIYQENQGMHGAHNTAYENITTELNVCIDSDDYMTDDAVELILTKYHSIKDKSDIAGIIGLDIDKNHKVIGNGFHKNIYTEHLYDIYYKYSLKGDKKLVLKTEIVKKYPKYPLFEKERFVPLSSLYFQIDKSYKFLCTNDELCVVEYMADGSTMNIFKQYKKHPNGFRYSRLIEMSYHKLLKNKIKTILHFISSTIYTKKYNFFENNPKKIHTLLLLPVGFLFHLYIENKQKENK